MGAAAKEPVIVVTQEQLRELVRLAVREELRGAAASTDEYLTTAQVAKILKQTTRNVHNLVHEHGLPCSPLGRSWRFKRSDLEAWLASRAKKAG